MIVVVNLRSCWTGFLEVGFFACLAFCGYSMVSTALGMGLGWDSFLSSCTVTTLSNLEMPYTVMVPTIALYHSGVGAVVSPVSFLSRRHMFAFCSFLPYFKLIGCCDHAY